MHFIKHPSEATVTSHSVFPARAGCHGPHTRTGDDPGIAQGFSSQGSLHDAQQKTSEKRQGCLLAPRTSGIQLVQLRLIQQFKVIPLRISVQV